MSQTPNKAPTQYKLILITVGKAKFKHNLYQQTEPHHSMPHPLHRRSTYSQQRTCNLAICGMTQSFQEARGHVPVPDANPGGTAGWQCSTQSKGEGSQPQFQQFSVLVGVFPLHSLRTEAPLSSKDIRFHSVPQKALVFMVTFQHSHFKEKSKLGISRSCSLHSFLVNFPQYISLTIHLTVNAIASGKVR